MSNRKIPPDAFFYYVGLGPGRSYQAVADHYQVTKRAVVNLAVRERWQERVDELERQARQSANEKALETLEDMNERHLKMLKVVQSRALEALKNYSLDSASAASRALESSIRQERVIRGEPGDRTATNVEDVIRREYERWMVVDGDSDHDDGDAAPTESA